MCVRRETTRVQWGIAVDKQGQASVALPHVPQALPACAPNAIPHAYPLAQAHWKL